MNVTQRAELFVDWQASAIEAERKCAELAAAIDALMQDEYMKKRVASVRLGIGTAVGYGKVVVRVLDSGYSAILAQHDAEVKRRVLERIERMSCQGTGGRYVWMESIELAFAPKGESDAKRD